MGRHSGLRDLGCPLCLSTLRLCFRVANLDHRLFVVFNERDHRKSVSCPASPPPVDKPGTYIIIFDVACSPMPYVLCKSPSRRWRFCFQFSLTASLLRATFPPHANSKRRTWANGPEKVGAFAIALGNESSPYAIAGRLTGIQLRL